jgi:hypothetical protein
MKLRLYEWRGGGGEGESWMSGGYFVGKNSALSEWKYYKPFNSSSNLWRGLIYRIHCNYTSRRHQCKVSHSDSGSNDEFCLLGCDAVFIGVYVPIYRYTLYHLPEDRNIRISSKTTFVPFFHSPVAQSKQPYSLSEWER